MRKVGDGGGGVVSNRGRWAIFSLFSFVFHSCSAFPFLSFLTLFCVFFLVLSSPSQDNPPLFPSALPCFFLSFSFFFLFFPPIFPSLFCLFFLFFFPSVFFSGGIYRGSGSGIDPIPVLSLCMGVRPSCPIMVPGEVANEGVACRARLLDFHHPLVFHHKEVWVALGFDSVCASGGGSEMGRNKR